MFLRDGLSTAASIVSIILNLLLIILLRANAKRVVGLYHNMMIGSAVYDTLFSIMFIIAAPTLTAKVEEQSVFILKAGIPMPLSAGRFILVCWVFFLSVSIAVSPCHFIFRYIQVCMPLSSYNKRTYSVLLVPIVMASIGGTMLSFSSWPSRAVIVYFEHLMYPFHFHGAKSFLVASLDARQERGPNVRLQLAKAIVLKVTIVYLIAFLVLNIIIMLFCSHNIMKSVKRIQSKKSRDLQKQLHTLLVAQFIVPFLCIHTPFYVCLLAPLCHVDTGLAADYLPILFACSPALNPLIILYLVRDLRSSSAAFFKTLAISQKCFIKSRSDITVRPVA
ncbi:hypothetical protein Q1695_007258 [Nippostrongylus brasiliensis]|nr:hypothetical protein Q1695_007258 [Nippostrongylus brasiliensis]